MLKILAMADLHLGYPRGELKKFGLEDCLEAISDLKQKVKELTPDILIVAGDVFNGVRVDSEELYLFSEFLKAVAPIPRKLSIQGNHDRGAFSIPEYLGSFTALSEVPVDVEGVSFAGISATSTEKHREFLQNCEADVQVVHFPMSPFSRFGEPIDASECKKDKLVIVGDTHIGEVYLKNDRCVISPGCLFPTNKFELVSGNAGTSYMILLEKSFSGDLNLNITRLALATRFGVDLTRVSVADELRHTLEAISREKAVSGQLKPIAYVQTGLEETHIEGWELIPVNLVAESVSPDSVDFAGLDSGTVGDRIRKALERKFENDPDKDALVKFTSELIESDVPEKVIGEFVNA